MEITHLGSGSRGNSVLLSTDESKVVVDCGFSLKRMESRLDMIGVNPSEIDAIMVTHHHSDHSRSAARASKKWASVLMSNAETARRMEWGNHENFSEFSDLERVEAGNDLSFLPIPVPHDDADNVAIIACSSEGKRAAVVTDLGEATDELKRHLSACSHISIEANYEHSRLVGGPYPDSLKRRITGRGGHLSNTQTGQILNEVMHEGLESIVLCHLSENNNRPHIAESEVLMRICDSFSGDLSISKQSGPEFTHWLGQSEPERIYGLS
jgi:phosphoribosyl 1,2-cyclic phosphodiesterase